MGPVVVSKVLFVIVAIVGAIALVSTFAAEIQAGQASVIDGDTIEIHGQRIRLFGVDAPESAQLCTFQQKPWRCGQQSARALAEYLDQATVFCRPRGKSYERIVAVCFKGGYDDVGARQVSEGWAVAAPKYSPDYLDEQAQARAKLKGVWGSLFDPPAQWRRAHHMKGATKDAATEEQP